ncbi:MAG: hypothetical protein NZ844_13300, partial [Chloroherpetonaceae bacterium]|nr:hypothetical protein [Chloroherpetonaceae bacterium]
ELVRICDADTSLKRLINAEARELFVVQDANHINIIWKSAGAISDWLLSNITLTSSNTSSQP